MKICCAGQVEKRFGLKRQSTAAGAALDFSILTAEDTLHNARSARETAADALE
jgi:hypothetical protein